MISRLGAVVISFCDEFGSFGVFFVQLVRTLFSRGCRVMSVLYQMSVIGVDSVLVVILTGSAIGAVLAMQGYNGLHRFGADRFLGPLEYFSMTREFGSVVSAIMVIARAGSAMTAEIGSMNISEQIDALTTLSIDPIYYVVLPRVIASTFVLPLLSLFCVVFGVGAGYCIAVYVLGVNAELYVESIRTQLVLSDITKGLFKAVVFGLLFALICTYKGINARGGARGIGEATTQSVVLSCVAVFIGNYIMSAVLFS